MIKHISYYKDGNRHIVKPNSKGKFSIVVGAGQYGKPEWVELTAKEFVEHPLIRDFDPTLTLEDGNKLRVYHAGNSNIPIVHPSLVMDKFDKQSRDQRKSALERKLEKLKKENDKKEGRKQVITQPMAPIAPPYPGKKVKVSSTPPQKKDDSDDPFGPILDAWFGVDDADDPNDGLYEDDYQYGYDDDGDW